MKKLSNILTVVFIVLLVFISSRFVVFISFVKSQKTEFRQQVIALNISKTKHLQISNDLIFQNKNGIEWKENNKELVINGEFFEVISVIKINKNYLVTIIEDKEENELFKNYFHLNTRAKNSLKDMSTLFIGFNFLETTSNLLPKHFCKALLHQSLVCLFNSDSFKNKVHKPPGLISIA